MVSVDETALAEREGKRGSTGQMNVAGWARESAPWRLYKWRLQCCAHGTVPHVPAPTVAISTLKAPFAPPPPTRVFFSGRSQRPSLLPKRQQIICPVLFTPSFLATPPSLFRVWVSCWLPSLLSRVPRHPRRCGPLLSGAQTGEFPASLPRTFGAAMAASSAHKDPTDELQEQEHACHACPPPQAWYTRA